MRNGAKLNFFVGGGRQQLSLFVFLEMLKQLFFLQKKGLSCFYYSPIKYRLACCLQRLNREHNKIREKLSFSRFFFMRNPVNLQLYVAVAING